MAIYMIFTIHYRLISPIGRRRGVDAYSLPLPVRPQIFRCRGNAVANFQNWRALFLDMNFRHLASVGKQLHFQS